MSSQQKFGRILVQCLFGISGLGLLLSALAVNAQDDIAVPDPLAEAASLDDPLTADSSRPQTAEPTTHEIENPYGFEAMWKHGDFVSKGTLFILFFMSAGTWYVLIVKLLEQTKLNNQAKQAEAEFWSSATVADGKAKLTQGGAFWYIVERGMNASEHHEGTMVEQIDRSSWITMSVNRAVESIQSKLTGGLAVLATVGSTAPFVGLFGTVWGIYHALTAIGVSGQASIDKVAGPVGEALIMTAIGLAVAVPAVLAYNWLVRRNKNCMEKVRAFASDLHSVLLSGTRVGEQNKAA